jgi:hypothetical protein
LGTNIFRIKLKADVENFKGGAKIFLKKSPGCPQFGVCGAER